MVLFFFSCFLVGAMGIASVTVGSLIGIIRNFGQLIWVAQNFKSLPQRQRQQTKKRLAVVAGAYLASLLFLVVGLVGLLMTTGLKPWLKPWLPWF